MPGRVWRVDDENPDPDTPPRACPDSGLNAWDERGTEVVRARAWLGHVAELRTPVRRFLRNRTHQHITHLILHERRLAVRFYKCTSANVKRE